MNRLKTLSPADIDHFLSRGYVKLTRCFSRETASEWIGRAWTRLELDGIRRDDPSTWTRPRVHMPNSRFVHWRDFSPRAYGAVCDLLGGEERLEQPCCISDGFIINFSIGTDREWAPPSPQSPGWHKDGDFFRHFLDSPEQGLLTLIIWSDIPEHGGGTFVACDSVAPVARWLRDHPEGVVLSDFSFAPLIHECREFVATDGSVGDIYLLHPFILHASSPNHSGIPRWLTNPPVHLAEPMRFDREDPSEFSPVERTVLRALGVDRLEYRITGQRGRVVSERMKRHAQQLEEERRRQA